ncbi:hypothetical protein ABB37_06184 [Leptomonas pyrrhocoris]|uniref:Uncharacterized protein n=1 Tax=Leptomonas pyrrhocoris TaxID=157538 RepID=A0A0N0DU90_LEPPY|nr:hypothetical protein ABB37_06184 [Leptomonas pyrrhocoris]KPA78584.1 hypothetical protein ABB37_06184 [Leptomonas pyrrhocoris]|eukprot:XP_015657023.1 hypothetical protein ABB37_06184 [Leptomonas pyrrhocoris]
MRSARRRSTAAPPPSKERNSLKGEVTAARKMSSPKIVAAKRNSSSLTAKKTRRKQSTQQQPATTTAAAETATVGPAPSSPPSAPPPRGEDKKPRKESATVTQPADAPSENAPVEPAPSPPEPSKDAVVGGTVATTTAPKRNSGNGGSSGSIRLSPAPPPSSVTMLSPINEIHCSLTQLYLTPISASLSSPHAGFTALHFDGRSASWSNSGTTAVAGAIPGGPLIPANRRGSDQRHSGSGGSGGLVAVAGDDFVTGAPHAQRMRTRGSATSPLKLPHGGNLRPRQTSASSSSTGHPDAGVTDASARRGQGKPQPPPPSQVHRRSSGGASTQLSVTAKTLFATTDTVAVPLTPPVPPPLTSTVKSPSPAGGRLPPTPPPFDNSTRSAGGSSGSEGRHGSWNLASNWSPTEPSPTPVVSAGTTGRSGLTLRQWRDSDDDAESPNERSFYSTSIVSTVTSTFDEQPPPPPPPPAQLNLGVGSRGRQAAPPPLPMVPVAPQKLFSPTGNESISLFLDANIWHKRGRRGRSSTTDSNFSIRESSVASLRQSSSSESKDGSHDDDDNAPSAHRGSFFPSSHVSLDGAEPLALCPPTSDSDPNGEGNVQKELGADLQRHDSSPGAKRGGWGGAGPAPPPLSLESNIQPSRSNVGGDKKGASPSSPAEAGGAARKGSASGDGPFQSPNTPPSLKASESGAGSGLLTNEQTKSQRSTPTPTIVDPDATPQLESSLIIKEHPSSASLSSGHGTEASTRQQELARSFRNRIQVGVRAPKRKQTIRRVPSSLRGRRSSVSDGAQRGSSGRTGSAGSSGSNGLRRSVSSRRSGRSTGNLAGSPVTAFVRAAFILLACAQFRKAAVTCRARHRYEDVDAPRAAFLIQCAWRRRQQRRRIRESNAVQLLVPWVRLHLRRLRKTKEVSALLLQRVFRGQVVRSFHQFLYARMQYNKALDVVLRAVRRLEAQKMLFRLRLQRDERVVLIGQCIQGCLQVLRAEQMEWGGLVDGAAATLGTRPCVSTCDWVSGVAARTGVVLNPAAAAASGNEDLFHLKPTCAMKGNRSNNANSGSGGQGVGAGTRLNALRQQLRGFSQLESYAYLDTTRRTRKNPDPHMSFFTVSALLPGSAELHVDDSSPAAPAAAVHKNEESDTEHAALTGALASAASSADSGDQSDQALELLPAATVTDNDVVDAFLQLIIRIESAERVELERKLLAEQEAVLHTPSLVNQAVAYIVAQQLPLLFAPLLLAMSSTSSMRQAVRLFAAERAARCHIIALYESMPLSCLSRPMLNPAAGQRHANLVQLMRRAPNPWIEAELNEHRLYQEWTSYKHRTTYGPSDTKSLTSPRLSYGQHLYAATPGSPPLPEEGSAINSHLDSAVHAPIVLDEVPSSIATSTGQVPSPAQRRAAGGGGIRVRMTPSFRSSAATSATQSVPSAVLAPPPPLTNSVSISRAPSDSYTRVDVKSKTALPCPKRRPRGPPLPLLRTLTPVTTRGPGSNLHRPSFRNGGSSPGTPSHSPLRVPDLVRVTVSGTPTKTSAVTSKGSEGMSSLLVAAPPPIRADRRNTVAPQSLPSSFLPFQKPCSMAAAAAAPSHGGVGPAGSLSSRSSQMCVFSDEEEEGEEERITTPNKGAADRVDSLALSPLVDGIEDEGAANAAMPSCACDDVADQQPSTPVSASSPLRRVDSWASSKSSSSFSSAFLPADAANAAGSRGAHPLTTAAATFPPRAPTPPPRRCHAATYVPPAHPSPSSSPPPFPSTTATSQLARNADERCLGRVELPFTDGKRPDSRGSATNRSANWSLSPTAKAIPSASPFLPPASTTRLPSLSERQAPTRSFGLTA